MDRLRAAAAVDIIMCMGWVLKSDIDDVEEFARNRDRALHLVRDARAQSEAVTIGPPPARTPALTRLVNRVTPAGNPSLADVR